MRNLFIVAGLITGLVAFSGTGRALFYNPLVTGPGDDPTSSLYAVTKVVVTIVLVLLALTGAQGPRLFTQLLRPIGLYLLIAGMSMIWTIDMEVSARSSAILILYVCFIAATVSLIGVGYAYSIILYYSVTVSAVCLAACLLLPEIGTHGEQDLFQAIHAGRWRGIFLHKNQLGAFSAVTLVILAFRSEQANPPMFVTVTGAFASTVNLLFSQSAAPVAAFIVTFLSYIYLKPDQGLWLSRAPKRLLVVVVVLATALGAPTILALLDRDISLTGRTLVWQLAYDAIIAHPYLGYGFGVGRSGMIPPFTNPDLGVGDIHSAYLNQMLDLGIGGVLVLTGVLIAALRAAFGAMSNRADDPGVSRGVFCILIFACVMGFVEVAPLQVDSAIGSIAFFSLVAAHGLRCRIFGQNLKAASGKAPQQSVD